MTMKISYDLCEKFLGQPDAFTETEDNHRNLERLKKILLKVIREQLTPRQQQVLLLYFFEQRNGVEIAELLSINKSTVSRILNRAVANVKKYLQYYTFR